MNKKKLVLPVIAGTAAAAALIAVFVKTHSDSVKQTVTDTMTAMADERAQNIKGFVQESEQFIRQYSEADEITALLADPDNKSLAEAAQSFTETYSGQMEDLEGIYASTYDTLVLTHTDSRCIGMITRADSKSRDAFHNALESADDGLYRPGILRSPASGSQCLSMYQIVRNEQNEPVGFTGLGILTETLSQELQPNAVSGTKNAAFSMLSAAEAKYIFHKNDDLIGKETENASIKSLCTEVTGENAAKNGTLAYQNNGEKHVAAYSYMPEYGWLLVMDAGI